MTDRLDRIDRNILAALSREGRLSMSALTERVGLSKTPVQARVRRLMPEPPDLVLSGVNSGANLADDVTYSGTVAGAMEGTLLGYITL